MYLKSSRHSETISLKESARYIKSDDIDPRLWFLLTTSYFIVGKSFDL